MAIGLKEHGNSLIVHGIVLANFKSGLYCEILPSGKATAICFPFGLHEAHLNVKKLVYTSCNTIIAIFI